MKSFLSSLVALFVACTTLAFAQDSTMQLSTDPAATVVGTFAATRYLQVDATTQAKGTTRSDWNVVVFRTTTGTIEYGIDVRTIRFGEDGTAVDQMTASQIMEQISGTTIQKGDSLGFAGCQVSADPMRVAAVHAASVSHTGWGTATTFAPCGDQEAVRPYTVACSNGVESITRMAVENSNTYSGCESATGAATGGAIQ